MPTKLHEVKAELRRRMHDPVPEQGEWLRGVVRGYLNYYAVPGNIGVLQTFRYRIAHYWHHTLRRRSQKDRTNWARTNRLVESWLLRAKNLHPHPEQRLLVRTQGRSPVR